MRLTIIILLFVFGCTNPSNNEEQVAENGYSDSIPVSSEVPFDLKVKKYEDPTRQFWQDPSLVLDELGNLDGKVVADIGSGTGYFTFQLAGAASKVIAIDVEQRFLDYIEDRKSELSNKALANKIETRYIKPDAPALHQNEVDNVLMVNTFSYIENRIAYLDKIRYGMKDEGRLVIVDYKLGNIPVGPDDDHKVSMEQVIKELSLASFNVLRSDSASLQYQYIITAQK